MPEHTPKLSYWPFVADDQACGKNGHNVTRQILIAAIALGPGLSEGVWRLDGRNARGGLFQKMTPK
jgi:hypothetical protein